MERRLRIDRHGLLTLLLLISCFLVASVRSDSDTNGVLVLLDSLNMQETHSIFLEKIAATGQKVVIKSVDDKTVKLRVWDDWQFDKVIIIGGKSKLGAGITASTILDFFNAGHDVILALSDSPTSEMRNLAVSLGVDVAPSKTAVIDHFNAKSGMAADHTVIESNNLADIPAVFSAKTKGPVIFKGIGLSVSPESELAFHAVTASDTAYCGTPSAPIDAKSAPSQAPLAGTSIGLITLVQARNNARAAVIGSTAMFSDDFMNVSGSGNAMVANDVLQWALSLKSVLRASHLTHRIVGGEVSPSVYRINDMVEVSTTIVECEGDQCKPYQGTDVQVEFVMLDPYIRATLKPSKNGTFSAVVKIPDVYGVFKWVVDYRRLGYSWISDVLTIPVRPFKHHEYERFIIQAYPYYASTAAMMVGFFALGFFFLYSSSDSGYFGAGDKKKEN